MNRTQGFGSPSTIRILQGGIRSPLHRSWGTYPQLNWGLPNRAEASQLEVFAAPPNRLGYTMHPKGTSSWEHNAPKSNKLLELQSHESSWRAQPDATNAVARTQVLKSFTLKFPQSNKCLWGNKRGRTKRRIPKNSKNKIY